MFTASSQLNVTLICGPTDMRKAIDGLCNIVAYDLKKEPCSEHIFVFCGRVPHEPNVDCISKSKAHKRYEFGVKASIAVMAKESFIVGARSYPGTPYDGHTLKDQLQQVETLTGRKPETCFVDRGYKGSGVDDIKVLVAGQKRGVTKKEKNLMGRRNSVEPTIGPPKSDGKLKRCFLKGVLGDAINVILSACGQNLRKLLKWLNFAQKPAALLQLILSIAFLMVDNRENKMAF